MSLQRILHLVLDLMELVMDSVREIVMNARGNVRRAFCHLLLHLVQVHSGNNFVPLIQELLLHLRRRRVRLLQLVELREELLLALPDGVLDGLLELVDLHGARQLVPHVGHADGLPHGCPPDRDARPLLRSAARRWEGRLRGGADGFLRHASLQKGSIVVLPCVAHATIAWLSAISSRGSCYSKARQQEEGGGTQRHRDCSRTWPES
mmetsp:Transcript_63308/g.177041  ORF Transcript_63308/g.177041 Transcript_63308/m.177041 type:complete len:207 (+) Transcript_63308:582-1202(+)